MKADGRTVVEIDMRGQVCPSTLLVALREINARQKELRERKVALVFRTDNRACTHTIPESASTMGYEASVSREAGDYLIRVSTRERDVPR